MTRTLFDSDGPVDVEDAGLSATYWAHAIGEPEASALLESLVGGTEWRQPEISMFGRRVRIPRLTAWFGDSGASYVYSGIRNEPSPWSDPLRELRALVERLSGARFNSVLLNLYRTGEDHLSWHRDDEKELGEQPTIASVSLGAERVFALRTANTDARKPTYNLKLEHGSLLVMRGATQRHWEHSVKKEPKIKEPRLNLTFRWVHSKDERT